VGLRLKNDNIYLTQPLISGYFYNAATGALLFLMIWSLAWIPRLPGKLRAKRIQKQLALRLCPSCSYSLQNFYGLQCPECGTPIEPASTASRTESSSQ
jgi:hypothetical protein